LYPQDVLRCIQERDARRLALWALNLRGWWRDVPWADPKLNRAYLVFLIGAAARQALSPRAVVRLKEVLGAIEKNALPPAIVFSPFRRWSEPRRALYIDPGE